MGITPLFYFTIQNIYNVKNGTSFCINPILFRTSLDEYLQILACSWQKENPLQIFDYDTGMLMDYFDPDSTKNKVGCN